MTIEEVTDELEFHEPMVIMRMVGIPDAAEMLRALAEVDRTTVGWRFNVTLVDLTRQVQAASAETRKAIAGAVKTTVPSRGTALFGASFAMRTVGALLMNVINITNKTSTVTKFFNTEQEARAWLDQRCASER